MNATITKLPTPQPKAKPTQACYWIIGAKRAPAQAPAVAIDLLDEHGELCNPFNETHTITMRPHARGHTARKLALAYARKHGIKAAQVHYDPDSSEAFAAC